MVVGLSPFGKVIITEFKPLSNLFDTPPPCSQKQSSPLQNNRPTSRPSLKELDLNDFLSSIHQQREHFNNSILNMEKKFASCFA